LPVEDMGYTRGFTVLDQEGVQEMVESIINRYGLDIKYRKRIEKRLEAYKKGKTLY
jgi:predicted nucleic-acid-binding protein